jgi:hypothetical protein
MSRTVKRIGLVVLGLVVAVVAIGGGALYAMILHFDPSPPAAHYPHPANALEAQRQDIDYFARLSALDRAFAPAARTEADRRIAALKGLAAPLDHAHFRVALMQIESLADNGHSKVSYDPGATPRELPVRVAIFSDGLYVMRAAGDGLDLLGGRIVSIDGKPLAEVLARLETLRGGTPQWKKAYAVQYLYMQDMLYGLGIASDMQHSTWTVLSPAGQTVTRRLTAYAPSPDEAYVFVKRWVSSEKLKGLTKGWRAYQPDRPLPITLRDYDVSFRLWRPAHSCVAVVQLKSNADDNGQKIGDFVSSAEADLRAKTPCSLIVDLRYDDGGNYITTYGFASMLPGLVASQGRTFLLLGPSTFSAGISTSTFVKQAGADRVTILGEPVGDRLQFFSEGGRGCLPAQLSALCRLRDRQARLSAPLHRYRYLLLAELLFSFAGQEHGARRNDSAELRAMAPGHRSRLRSRNGAGKRTRPAPFSLALIHRTSSPRKREPRTSARRLPLGSRFRGNDMKRIRYNSSGHAL